MARKHKEEPRQRRQRRGVEQMISDLEAKIAAIKARDAQKKAKADPALRHASAALRSVDKALAATTDAKTKKALTEARSSLTACLGLQQDHRPTRSAGEDGDLADALLTHVRNNPGQRGEQIAAELGTDTDMMRPVMKRLIADGKVATEGVKRGMTYAAV